MSVETVEHAGTPQLKQFLMVSIKEFRGNELALAGAVKEDLACSGSSPLNKSDQVISLINPDGENESVHLVRASSIKLQASSFRTNLFKHQATSFKPQAASFKRQATSCKLSDPRTTVHGYRKSIRG